MRMSLKKIILVLTIFNGLLIIGLGISLLQGLFEVEEWYYVSSDPNAESKLEWEYIEGPFGMSMIFSSIAWMLFSSLLFVRSKSWSNGRFMIFYMIIFIAVLFLTSAATAYLIPQP